LRWALNTRVSSPTLTFGGTRDLTPVVSGWRQSSVQRQRTTKVLVVQLLCKMPKRKREKGPDNLVQSSEHSLLPQVSSRLVYSSPSAHFLQKRHYRQRAHANPFSDHALDYPSSPIEMDWDAHYPAFLGSGKTPEFADVGCGFGGLLIALAPHFPDTLLLGIHPFLCYEFKTNSFNRAGNPCSGLAVCTRPYYCSSCYFKRLRCPVPLSKRVHCSR
jgi:hypothetical protein